MKLHLIKLLLSKLLVMLLVNVMLLIELVVMLLFVELLADADAVANVGADQFP